MSVEVIKYDRIIPEDIRDENARRLYCSLCDEYERVHGVDVIPDSSLALLRDICMAEQIKGKLQAEIEKRPIDHIRNGRQEYYKTSMSRAKLQQLMDDETWMSARTAMDYGFADGLLTRGEAEPEHPDEDDDEGEADGKKPEDKPHDRTRVQYGRIAACARMRQRIAASLPLPKPQPEPKPEPASQAERDAFLSRLMAAAKHNDMT